MDRASMDIVVYRVTHGYSPQQSGDIVIDVGDVVEVEWSQLESLDNYKMPQIWLTGKNRSTGQTGMFPGTYVQYISDQMERNIPDAESNIYSAMSGLRVGGAQSPQQREHQLAKVYFLKPILCSACSDYIWGQGDVGVRCQACLLCFHNECANAEESTCNHCAGTPCSSIAESGETFPAPVLLTSWKLVNVLEWLASVNLYRYLDLFEKRVTTGDQLAVLSDEKLKELGVKDEFHRKAIMACVDELCGRRPTQRPGLVEPRNSRASSHRLKEHSFSSLQPCHVCDKPLYGLFHQGLQCAVCGLCIHRQCKMGKLPACSPDRLQRCRRPSFVADSIFGEGLGDQFSLTRDDGAPAVLVVCTEVLEQRAKENESDLIEAYRTTPSNETVNKLKNIFDTAARPLEIDLNIFDNSTVAGIIKKYLRDLPNPLIPVELYESFIEAVSGQDRARADAQLVNLVNQLPPHHHSVLMLMMGHFCRVCAARQQPDRPKRLGIVFCHIILRPARQRIINVVRNAKYHLAVFERLMSLGIWGTGQSYRSVPPPPTSPSHQPAANQLDPATMRLEDAEWYWGDVSREEVNERLNDSPDGSFLVRVASTNATHGDYTLTLRKGGTNKLIKIYHRNGKFGFFEPYAFSSVVELVNHFREHSLAEYNRSLDTTLKFPISRREQAVDDINVGQGASQIEAMFSLLKLTNRDYLEKTTLYDRLTTEQSKMSQEIQMQYQALEAFKETQEVFEEQKKLLLQHQGSAPQHELASLQENFKLLSSRLVSIMESKDMLEKNVREQAAQNQMHIAELNSLKPEIRRTHKLREQCIKSLLEQGISRYQIDKVLEEQETGKQSSPPPTNDDSHFDKSTWFISCLREEAEAMLAGKKDGSFLIRESTQKGCFALSIVHKGKVSHCKIIFGSSGYGFAEPYLIHDTLTSLVLHYKEVSLAEHNEDLDVRLTFPVTIAPYR